MAPIEIRPIYSGGRGPVPVPGSRDGVPPGWVRPAFVFDANRDGPWPRTRRELIAKANTLHEVMIEINSRWELKSLEGPWPAAAEYVRGVRAAAYWTLGAEPLTPMSVQAEPVTDEAVKAQARLAAASLDTPGEQDRAWLAFCSGVLSWLSWIVGARDTILWPDVQ